MPRENLKVWQVCIVASLLVFGACATAFAQYDTGSIVGIVSDKSGAVIAGADVKITNTKTNRVLEVKTGSTGEYAAPDLPTGPYKVEVEQAGFKTGVVSGIVLHATDRRNADVVLDVGSVTEQITVTAERAAVNTQTSETGASIDTNLVSNLPLNGRDFISLTALVPGSVTTGAFGQDSLGGIETTFAGVNVLLDGADATRIDTNATSTQLGRQDSRISRASVDSIEEFRIMSSTYSAEYGRSTGDIINVITKSGGNLIHGTVFDYFRNDALDAMNYFATESTPLRLNQFGGNFSGPIKKDKLFYFVNYEGVRQIANQPTGPIAVLGAADRALFVSSMYPVRDALPPPNVAGPVTFADGTVRNDLGYYEGNYHNTLDEDTASLKVDYDASEKDTFAFRYNVNNSYTSTQYGIAADQVSPSSGTNHLLKGTWNHTLRSNLLNSFGIAFNRPQTDSLGGGGNFPIFSCSTFWGCTNANTFGDAPGPALFSNRRPQHSLQFLDTLSWVSGRHSVRTGLDIRHVVTHSTLDPQDFLAYDNLTDFVNNVGIQLSTLGYTKVGLQNTNYGFFVQDDFRVAPRLTMNLGLRYEYNSVLHGAQIGNFDIATLSLLPQGAPLYKPDHDDFGPRVGFAWDPAGKGKTVVRGGFGIFYDPMLTGAGLSLASNYQQSFSINLIQLLFGLSTCTPALNLAYPLPSTLPTCTPPLPANVNSLDQNIRDSYSMHWSLGIQQEIAHNTVLEVSYVANHGVKLPAGAAYAGQELNLSPFSGAANVLSSNYGEIRHLGDFVVSSYNSLQASLRRRVAKGLNVDANYTWAHELDDGVNILTGAYQNSRNPMGDYADGDIDVRNNFTVGAVYDVPAAKRAPARLGNGWQMSALLQARGGMPFNIAVADPFLGEDQIRPNLVAGQSLRPSDYNVPSNQINAAALATPAADEYGTLGRNAGRGPGFTQLDFALSKTTRLTERLGMQLRIEMFDLVNHPNFANPSGILTDPNFGKSTSTIGNLVETGTSRQGQLALKFLF